MPRPLVPSRQLRHRFDLYLDEAEMERIRSNASAAGLPMSTFVRRSALGQSIRPAPSSVSLERWRELAPLAANLNQIAHACHLGLAPPDVAPTVAALAEQVRQLRLELLGAAPSNPSRGRP